MTRVLDWELACDCFLLMALATASKAWLRDLDGDVATCLCGCCRTMPISLSVFRLISYLRR